MSVHEFGMRLMQDAQRKITEALRRVEHARTLRELAQAVRLSLRPEIRGMRASLPGMSRLRVTAEDRAKQLTHAQVTTLQELVAQGQMDAFTKELNRLRGQEWVHLRGNFPLCARYVEDEVRRMLAQNARREPVEQDKVRSRPRP